MNQGPQQEDPLTRLSKRERLIAKRFAEGLTYREIGDALYIAPSTVRTHIAAIYRKLEIRNKTALVRLWAKGQSGNGQANGGSRRTKVDRGLQNSRPNSTRVQSTFDARKSGGDGSQFWSVSFAGSSS